MRSLFAKIFLSFFLTVLLLGALLEITALRSESRRVQEVFRPIAMQAARDAAAAYERGGDIALAPVLEKMPFASSLLDEHGQTIGQTSAAAQTATRTGAALLRGARESPSEFTTFGNVGLAPVTSDSGRRYVLVFALPHERWSAVLNTLDAYPSVRLTIVGIVAGVICFVLARHITTPLVRLRATVGRMAEGDLDARAGAAIARRHDEIGALGGDFDRMAERLSSLVSAERRLLADVSHELRSPLARLTVAVGLLRQRADPAAPEELVRIEREVERLDTLIGQSLTLARIDSGVSAHVGEPVDLAALVQEVAADGDYEARAGGKRVEAAAEACTIAGVPDLLRSAIENVIRNAIHYTAPGTTVVVRLTRELAAGPVARVQVRDRGPGIPEGLLTEVFLPFRRVESHRSRASGAGLGLAIAARVARLHGGTIEARNASDGGLIVELTIPIDPERRR